MFRRVSCSFFRHVVSSHADKNFGAADLSAEVRGEKIKCNERGAV